MTVFGWGIVIVGCGMLRADLVWLYVYFTLLDELRVLTFI